MSSLARHLARVTAALRLIVGALLWACVWVPGAAGQEVDADSGFIKSEGWELVNRSCTRCHSAAIITQNSGSEAVWKSRIVWMQETQGLEQLAALDEQRILAYLAANYGQKSSSRRAALSAALLPKNPYGDATDE